MHTWADYYKKHTNREPRALLVRAVSSCVSREAALDLGAGTLIESKYLVESGFKKVVAVDSSVQMKEFVGGFDKPELVLVVESFKDFDFSKYTFDLINAQFALPFYGKTDFPIFIKKVIASLLSDGIFVGQFFGINDSWNTSDSDIAFHTKEEVLDFLSDLEILEFTEEEKDATTASSEPKHWHVFHFITKKS
jgi:tellurite methyltransferase